MTRDRELEVADAFVSLASSLANGYDVVDLLSQLTAECVQLLDVPAAGLLLTDGLGVLHLMAASSERMRLLELFQLQRDQGPCLDCFRSGAPVSIADLEQEEQRWPQFVPAAREAGFASVHALPMRWREDVLGALGLFGTEVGALAPRDLALGQALADVASVALVQEQAAVDRIAVNEQLQQALTSRIVLEQAKGLLAQQGGLDMVSAFTVLRRYARDHNRRLTDLAQEVVDRKLNATELLRHARSKGISTS
ncbi:MAG: hypothetical protein JWM40_2714 [Frankiales bacterium]|nr:hypothetical protein [Frankiales bacterium]